MCQKLSADTHVSSKTLQKLWQKSVTATRKHRNRLSPEFVQVVFVWDSLPTTVVKVDRRIRWHQGRLRHINDGANAP